MDNSDKLENLDFDRLTQIIDQAQLEKEKEKIDKEITERLNREPDIPKLKKEEDKISYTLNGENKEFSRYSGITGKDKWKKEMLGDYNIEPAPDVPQKETSSNSDDPIKYDYDVIQTSSLVDEEYEVDIQKVQVPIGQKNKLDKIKTWCKVSVLTLLTAISMGLIVPKQVKKSTWTKPIGVNKVVATSDENENLRTSMYNIGSNLANRILKEKSDYEFLDKDYNIENQIKLYFGVAANEVVRKLEYTYNESLGLIENEEGHFQYISWFSKIYEAVKNGLAGTYDLPATAEIYLMQTTGLEDPTEALKVIVGQAKAVEKVANPAYETEKEYEAITGARR